MTDYKLVKAINNGNEYGMGNNDYCRAINKIYYMGEEYCIPKGFEPICFGYTGEEQCITLNPGKYCIEVRGAEGGKDASSCYANGPKGAYAAGTIKLTSQSTFYIYVGGKGCNAGSYGSHSVAGGWNGGGTGGGTTRDCATSGVGGGGGGTDVRYNGNTLYNRFIVAGGGSGGGAMRYYTDRPYTGNNGGGGGTQGYGVWPGTQTSAGRCGSFGQGANMCGGYNNATAPGGGGGWYGGGGCYSSGNDGNAVTCGSGGSSYTYTEDTCGNHPCKICLGDLPLMTNAVCCGCADTFPTADGGTETGHIGCGCVKISKA